MTHDQRGSRPVSLRIRVRTLLLVVAGARVRLRRAGLGERAGGPRWTRGYNLPQEVSVDQLKLILSR